MNRETSESNRLDEIASRSLYAFGLYTWTLDYCFEVLQRFILPGPVLELGPAEGLMTDRLVACGHPLTLVEGAASFCVDIKNRHPTVTVVNALFEDFVPTQHFQTIVLGHVLEHVESPIDLLRRVRTWLLPGGRVFAAVPNSRSIHRQAAVVLGMLPFEETLNELDVHHGHRRVYNPETLRRDFSSAGLNVDAFGGYFIKPLSQGQLAQVASADVVRALCVLGERYPDISAEIYVVASAHG